MFACFSFQTHTSYRLQRGDYTSPQELKNQRPPSPHSAAKGTEQLEEQGVEEKGVKGKEEKYMGQEELMEQLGVVEKHEH